MNTKAYDLAKAFMGLTSDEQTDFYDFVDELELERDQRAVEMLGKLPEIEVNFTPLAPLFESKHECAHTFVNECNFGFAAGSYIEPSSSVELPTSPRIVSCEVQFLTTPIHAEVGEMITNEILCAVHSCHWTALFNQDVLISIPNLFGWEKNFVGKRIAHIHGGFEWQAIVIAIEKSCIVLQTGSNTLYALEEADKRLKASKKFAVQEQINTHVDLLEDGVNDVKLLERLMQEKLQIRRALESGPSTCERKAWKELSPTSEKSCPECRGTGQYVGFTKVEPCTECNGNGKILSGVINL